MKPYLDNPVPHLTQAAAAAVKVFQLKRDLALLNAEIQAIRQTKRIAFGIVAAVCFALLLAFTCFWITFALHERGVSSGALALGSFVFFGAGAALFAWIAIQVGKAPPDETDSPSH